MKSTDAVVVSPSHNNPFRACLKLIDNHCRSLVSAVPTKKHHQFFLCSAVACPSISIVSNSIGSALINATTHYHSNTARAAGETAAGTAIFVGCLGAALIIMKYLNKECPIDENQLKINIILTTVAVSVLSGPLGSAIMNSKDIVMTSVASPVGTLILGLGYVIALEACCCFEPEKTNQIEEFTSPTHVV